MNAVLHLLTWCRFDFNDFISKWVNFMFALHCKKAFKQANL